MSRRSNQKLKILYLSRILLEQTGEHHGMTLTEISNELSKYGIESGRKSLYDDMEALRFYGFDVCSKRDRYIRYYIKDRTFGLADLKLLADMIKASKALTDKNKSEIFKKVREQGVAFDSDALCTGCYAVSAFSEDTYKNIELICRAISENKRLKFKCFEWNAKKQRILLSGGDSFTVSPWQLKLHGGSYVLIGFDHSKGKVERFLPERLFEVTIDKKSRGGAEEFLCFRADDSELVNIRLQCDNALAGDVISHFGLDVTILANREECFEFSVKAPVDDSLYSWVFTKCGQVRILHPQWVAESYNRMLRGNVASTAEDEYEEKS